MSGVIVEHWEDLNSKYRSKDFAVFLEFRGQMEDAEYVVAPAVVYSYPD